MSSVPAIHVTLEGTDYVYRLEPSEREYAGGVRWAAGRGSGTWLSKVEMRALSGVPIRAHFEGDPGSLEYGAMKHVRTRPRGTAGSKQVGTDRKRTPWRERTQGAVVIKSDGVFAQVKVTAIVDGDRAYLTCVAMQQAQRAVLTPAQRKKKYYESMRMSEQEQLEKLARRSWLSLAQTGFYIGRTYNQTKRLAKAGAFDGARRDRDRYVTGRPIPYSKSEKFGPVWHIPRASVDAWLAENGGRGSAYGQRPRGKRDEIDSNNMRWEACEVCGDEWQRRVTPGPRPSKCDRCRFERRRT